MKKNNKELDIVFLLDRSGSMNGMEKDTIGGYNSYLEEQRKSNNKINITTVLFDNEYELLLDRKDIKEVKPLTEKEYYVRGCTALLDAIGKTIIELDRKTNNKVLFVITTDGLENASHEYTKEKIKEMINGHSNWEFIFIGADIDSFSEASSIGIKRENIANYKKDTRGVKALFSSVNKASRMMYQNEKLSSDWKKELNEYIDNNKNVV